MCVRVRWCVCVSRENQVNQNERIIRSAQKIIRQPVPLTKESEECVSSSGSDNSSTVRDGAKRNGTGLLACRKLETNSRRFNDHIKCNLCIGNRNEKVAFRCQIPIRICVCLYLVHAYLNICVCNYCCRNYCSSSGNAARA